LICSPSEVTNSTRGDSEGAFMVSVVERDELSIPTTMPCALLPVINKRIEFCIIYPVRNNKSKTRILNIQLAPFVVIDIILMVLTLIQCY
jgi:hypothetical protein